MYKSVSRKTADRQQPRVQTRELKIENCKYCGAVLIQRQCPAFVKMVIVCGRQNLFQAVCWSSRGKTQMRPAAQTNTWVAMPRWGRSNKNFDSVIMKTLIFHSIKSVIFTRLDSSTSEKEKNVYKIDTGTDGNLILFSVFRILFLR